MAFPGKRATLASHVGFSSGMRGRHGVAVSFAAGIGGSPAFLPLSAFITFMPVRRPLPPANCGAAVHFRGSKSPTIKPADTAARTETDGLAVKFPVTSRMA